MKIKDEGETDVDECKHGYEAVTMYWAMIVSVFCVGGIIGGSAVGVVASRLGRFVIFEYLPTYCNRIILVIR